MLPAIQVRTSSLVMEDEMLKSKRVSNHPFVNRVIESCLGMGLLGLMIVLAIPLGGCSSKAESSLNEIEPTLETVDEMLAKGQFWNERDQLDKGLEFFERALQLDPNSAEAFLGRGITWNKKGETESAISDFTQAIRLTTNDERPYHRRADVWHAKKEYEKAIHDYDRGHSHQSKFVDCLQQPRNLLGRAERGCQSDQ